MKGRLSAINNLNMISHLSTTNFFLPKFSRKKPQLGSLFNKAAGLSLFKIVTDTQACNFNQKRLQHRSFPVNNYFEEHLRMTASKK